MTDHPRFAPLYRTIFDLLNMCYAARPFGMANDLSNLTEYKGHYPTAGKFYLDQLNDAVVNHDNTLYKLATSARDLFNLVKVEEKKEEERKRTISGYATQHKMTLDTVKLDQQVQADLGKTCGILFEKEPGKKQKTPYLSERTACNKIIHRGEPELKRRFYSPKRRAATDDKNECRYWTGHVIFRGTEKKRRIEVDWKLDLDVAGFLQVLYANLSELEHGIHWPTFDGKVLLYS